MLNKIKILRVLLCFLALMLMLPVGAQTLLPVCGFDKVYGQQLADPLFAQKRIEGEALIQNKLAEIRMNRLLYGNANILSDGLVEIPVVVHVIYRPGDDVGTRYNPSDAQIQSMINHLNGVFSATVPQSVGAAIPLRFALAKRSPDGCSATTGINRVDGSTIANYVEHGLKLPGSTAVGASDTEVKNSSHWPGTQYYNIWVVWQINDVGLQPNTYIGGFASLPVLNGEFVPVSARDGAVLNAIVVNGTNSTLSHEMGHAMGLLHTFAPLRNNINDCPPAETNCTTQGDLVCDTDPVKNLILAGCLPNADTNTCTNQPYNNHQKNIMGYGSCLDRFTQGQSERVMAAFTTLRMGFRSSLGSVEPPPTQVTAADPPSGIRNANNLANMGPCNITLNNLTYTSKGYGIDGNRYYIDNSCNIGTKLSASQSHTITITTETNPQYCKVWIDFNNSGTFEENEIVLSSHSSGANATHTASIPPTRMTGDTVVANTLLRMRVTADRDTITSPVAVLSYGQAEDFWVVIEPALPAHFGNIEANIRAEMLHVSWITLDEQSNSHFIVEASKDGKRFITIGKVASKASNAGSATPLSYGFTISLDKARSVLAGIFFALLLGIATVGKKNRWIFAALLLGSILLAPYLSCRKNDHQIATGTQDEFFIRIRQINADGTGTSSKIIRVNKE